jgi:four helix bundle protein
MGVGDWAIRDKPYDLRERLFKFACVITRLAQFLHTRGAVATALCPQLLKSGTSAGANYEEADDGSSEKDVRAKRQIVLRELKETSFRLRVLREVEMLTPAHEPVINECNELVKIVAALIRRSRAARVFDMRRGVTRKLATQNSALKDWKLGVGNWELGVGS